MEIHTLTSTILLEQRRGGGNQVGRLQDYTARLLDPNESLFLSATAGN
jgi:hypothetical protein